MANQQLIRDLCERAKILRRHVISVAATQRSHLGGSRKIGNFQVHMVDEIWIDFIGTFVGGQDIQRRRFPGVRKSVFKACVAIAGITQRGFNS